MDDALKAGAREHTPVYGYEIRLVFESVFAACISIISSVLFMLRNKRIISSAYSSVMVVLHIERPPVTGQASCKGGRFYSNLAPRGRAESKLS